MVASDHLNEQQFSVEDIGKMEAYNYPGRTVQWWHENDHGGSNNAEQRDLDASVAKHGVLESGLTDSTRTVLLEGHHRYRAAVRGGKNNMTLRVDPGTFDKDRFRKIHGPMEVE